MNLYERGYLSNLTLFDKAVKKGLNVEYVDIETSTNIGCFYGHKKLYINKKQIKVPLKITSVVLMNEKDLKPTVFKWDWKGPYVIDYTGVKGGGDDSKLLEEIYQRLLKSDLLVAQNGDNYDVKVLQDAFLRHGFPPLKNIITLDTLKCSRRSFYKTSHSLDSRSLEHGYGGKIKQDMDDCIDVSLGHPKKQDLRVKYNIKDVVDMRKVMRKEFNYYNLEQRLLNYLRMFIKSNKEYCKKCAARRQRRYEIEVVYLKSKNGKGKVKKWQCKNCLYRWTFKEVK